MELHKTMSLECVDRVATNRLPEIRNTVKKEIPEQLSGISSYMITWMILLMFYNNNKFS